MKEPDHWSEHELYPVSDWQYDVVNGNTRLGYWQWVESCYESEKELEQIEQDPPRTEGDML